MEETNRIALLEQEKLELKAEVEVLFNTVIQLNESINLLVNRYIINEDGR